MTMYVALIHRHVMLTFEIRFFAPVVAVVAVFPLDAKKCEFTKLCPADSQLEFNSA